MSYYHQNPDYDVYAYEYDDNGNHGNNEYEYDSYSDHYKPDHCGFEDRGYNNADHGDSPEGFEYGHGEPDGDGYEPMEPGYEDDEGRAHWEGGYSGEVEGYEHEEIEDEGDAIDETHEHGELTRRASSKSSSRWPMSGDTRSNTTTTACKGPTGTDMTTMTHTCPHAHTRTPHPRMSPTSPSPSSLHPSPSHVTPPTRTNKVT